MLCMVGLICDVVVMPDVFALVFLLGSTPWHIPDEINDSEHCDEKRKLCHRHDRALDEKGPLM